MTPSPTTPSQGDDPIRSPKTILSLHIGYEDLMLFYTDGTSESIALSEKCQKERQEQTDAFADAMRDAAEPAIQGDDWIDKVIGNLLEDHIDMYNQDRDSSAALGADIEVAKAAIQAQIAAAYERGRADGDKTEAPTVANIEGLLRDFAAEFAEPYKYMDNEHTPASQMPMARKKVTDKYAHRLKVWRRTGMDEAYDRGKAKGLYTQAQIDEAATKAIDLFIRDMKGYDFTPEDEGENTNALVADALQNSRKWTLEQLTTQSKSKEADDEHRT